MNFFGDTPAIGKDCKIRIGGEIDYTQEDCSLELWVARRKRKPGELRMHGKVCCDGGTKFDDEEELNVRLSKLWDDESVISVVTVK